MKNVRTLRENLYNTIYVKSKDIFKKEENNNRIYTCTTMCTNIVPFETILKLNKN